MLGLMNFSLLVSSVSDFCPSGSCQDCEYGASASSGSAACSCSAAAGAPSGAPSAVCAPCGPAATSTLVATRALATLCGRDQHFWVDEKKAHEALVETSLRLMFNSLRRDVCGVYGRGCGLT